MDDKTKSSKDLMAFKKNALKEEEEILNAILGFIGEMMGKGKDRQYNGILVCTNQRVVFYYKGFFAEVNRSIPLKKISSIDLDKGLVFSSINIHTSNDNILFRTGLKIDMLKNLQETIESQKGKDTNTENNPTDDPIEKIKKLAELRDSGIISEDEFNIKKNELMEKV
ncbi:PH domain-containing protein [Pelagibacterales bacterium]|nr:PH domain-containing protein [Pelagibacterales bacterium]